METLWWKKALKSPWNALHLETQFPQWHGLERLVVIRMSSVFSETYIFSRWGKKNGILELTFQDVIFIIGRVLRLRRNTHWHEYSSFDSLLSRAGFGNVGKGCILCGTTTIPFLTGCLTGLTGSSTQAGRCHIKQGIYGLPSDLSNSQSHAKNVIPLYTYFVQFVAVIEL